MKALITIAALTLSFSAYAGGKHEKTAKNPTAGHTMEAAKPANPQAEAAAKAECAKTSKTPAEVDACVKAKMTGTGHM